VELDPAQRKMIGKTCSTPALFLDRAGGIRAVQVLKTFLGGRLIFDLSVAVEGNLRIKIASTLTMRASVSLTFVEPFTMLRVLPKQSNR
jgi:hypothetical protein